MFTGIIIGVFIMSISAGIAVTALEDGHENLALVFSGPAIWLWVLIGGGIYRLYKRIQLAYFRRHYVQARTYWNGRPDDTIYIHKAVLPGFKFFEECYQPQGEDPNPGETNCIKIIKDCTDAKSVPGRRWRYNADGLGRKYREAQSTYDRYLVPGTEFYYTMVHGG